MLPIGHVSYTWAVLTWLETRGLVAHIDLRGAAIAAMLPDLVDKPLSLTIFAESGTSQGLAHTLLGQAMFTLGIGLLKSQYTPYALVANCHLVFDQMWKYPQTLLFPFSGRLDSWKFMGTPAAMVRAYAEIVTRPSIVALEMVGLALLGWVLNQGEGNWRQNLKSLLLKGTLKQGKNGWNNR